MKTTLCDEGEEARIHTIALAAICAAAGYACSLATTIYSPEHYAPLALAYTLAPAAYLAFRFVAHREDPPISILFYGTAPSLWPLRFCLCFSQSIR